MMSKLPLQPVEFQPPFQNLLGMFGLYAWLPNFERYCTSRYGPVRVSDSAIQLSRVGDIASPTVGVPTANTYLLPAPS